MIILIYIVLLLIVSIYGFMQQPKFGKLPSGIRLEKIKQSPNFRDGQFQNINHTPSLAEGVSVWEVSRKFFFEKSKRSKPPVILPAKKTNLKTLDPDQNLLVWFGHSSYYLQIDGKKILVDPVFSGAATPVKFTNKAYPGSDVYSASDFPDIDYLFITHDHWDHLDHDTVMDLQPKVKTVITSLGTAAHLEHWGYETDKIIEKDWNESIVLPDGFSVYTTPGRHFSGRTFKRNRAIWTSFVLKTPSMNIFLGGDSGYDTHFADIGKKYGPFDLAILECGQYNPAWKYIHMTPEETVQAGIDLQTKRIFPVHWAKFSLALHDWDDSIKRVVREAENKNMPLIHPMIGELVNLNTSKEFSKWWEQVK